MIHHNDQFIFKIHFMFKIMHLCVGSGFLVSHSGLRKPIHFYGLSPLGTMSDHNWRAFHLRKDLSLLDDTRYIFFFYHFNQSCDSVGCCPIYRAHPIKHQTQCQFTNHPLTPIYCDVPGYMQCMRHCIAIPCLICNECYMDHTSHASHHAFWTIITHAYNFQTSFLQC